VQRLDEEEVEGEDTEHRGGEGGNLAAADGHSEDGDQVEAAEARWLGYRVENRNECRCEADPGENLESRGGDAAEREPRTHGLHLDPV
jgi:hypothetical protein